MEISSPPLTDYIADDLATTISHCSNLSRLEIFSTGNDDDVVLFLKDGQLKLKSGSEKLLTILMGLRSIALQVV